MNTTAPTVKQALDTLLPIAEPNGEYTKVDVYIGVYVHRSCPVCKADVIADNPLERCLDCEDAYRRREEKRRKDA